jgi:hypothetical protein
MEATSEQQSKDAETTAKGGPLTQPLPLAGERSTSALAGERSSKESVSVAARPEESLLGAKPAPDTSAGAAQPTDPAPQEQEKPAAAEQPARPSYTEFKLPEGVAVDAEALKPATELFAESGLSQEQAQKFIDLALARETATTTRSVQAFVDLQNQWVSEIKADRDIGGERLKGSLASAARAIDRLDVPGLREALSFTGAGNHPAVVKAFVRLGQMIQEDRFRPGRDVQPATPRSPAEVIYDGGPKGSADGF